MNAVESREHEVLERTLDAVRRVRRRRMALKLAVLPLLLVISATWVALRRPPSEPMNSPVMVATSPSVKTSAESLTVVEWNGGMPSLVEYSGEELGKLELSFSLEPVVAFSEENW